jgi:hypothetical protein
MTRLPALLLGCLSLLGCAKEALIDPNQLNQSCSAPPEPVRFVLLGKQGQNLAAGAHPPISITFEENGQVQTLACTSGTLRRVGPDTTRKYGGVGAGCDLGGYSVRPVQPIGTFKVLVGGQLAGTLDYVVQRNSPARLADCYTVKVFRFNSQVVRLDSTVLPYVAVLRSTL